MYVDQHRNGASNGVYINETSRALTIGNFISVTKLSCHLRPDKSKSNSSGIK